MENIKKRKIEIHETKKYKQYWQIKRDQWNESLFHAQEWEKKVIEAYLSDYVAMWRLFHNEEKFVPWKIIGIDLYFEMNNSFSKGTLKCLTKTFRNIDKISDDGIIINLRKKELKEKAINLLQNAKIKLWKDIEKVTLEKSTCCDYNNNDNNKKQYIASIIKKIIQQFYHHLLKNKNNVNDHANYTKLNVKFALISAHQEYKKHYK